MSINGRQVSSFTEYLDLVGIGRDHLVSGHTINKVRLFHDCCFYAFSLVFYSSEGQSALLLFAEVNSIILSSSVTLQEGQALL